MKKKKCCSQKSMNTRGPSEIMIKLDQIIVTTIAAHTAVAFQSNLFSSSLTKRYLKMNGINALS